MKGLACGPWKQNEGEPTTRPQRRGDPREGLPRTLEEHHPEPREGGVEGARQVVVLHVEHRELDTGNAAVGQAISRCGDHRLRDVDAEHRAARGDPASDLHRGRAGAAADVDDALAGDELEAVERRGAEGFEDPVVGRGMARPRVADGSVPDL